MVVDVVELELRKSHQIDIDLDDVPIYLAESAARLFCREIGRLNVEHVAMLALGTDNRPANFFIVSAGEIDSVRVSLAQMFRCALLSNATKMMVAHNHPSGVLEVTSNDIKMTKKIGYVADCLGIELLDSLVVTGDGYVSIRARCKEL